MAVSTADSRFNQYEQLRKEKTVLKAFELRRDGSLLAALVVAAILASGAFSNPSDSAERPAAASDRPQVAPTTSPFVDYLNAVGDATAATESSEITLSALLAP